MSKETEWSPKTIGTKLLKHSINVTKKSRIYLEQNPTKREPSDHSLYPGKMDHTTCLTFRVCGYGPFIKAEPAEDHKEVFQMDEKSTQDSSISDVVLSGSPEKQLRYSSDTQSYDLDSIKQTDSIKIANLEPLKTEKERSTNVSPTRTEISSDQVNDKEKKHTSPHRSKSERSTDFKRSAENLLNMLSKSSRFDREKQQEKLAERAREKEKEKEKEANSRKELNIVFLQKLKDHIDKDPAYDCTKLCQEYIDNIKKG